MKSLIANLFEFICITVFSYVLIVLAVAPVLLGCVFLVNKCTNYKIVTIKENTEIKVKDAVDDNDGDRMANYAFNPDVPITIIK